MRALRPAHPEANLPSRMGGRMNLSEMTGINTCIDLRGCEAGMAEQGLDRSQICPIGEEMGCKTMAQGMWSRSFRQTERTAH